MGHPAKCWAPRGLLGLVSRSLDWEWGLEGEVGEVLPRTVEVAGEG